MKNPTDLGDALRRQEDSSASSPLENRPTISAVPLRCSRCDAATWAPAPSTCEPFCPARLRHALAIPARSRRR